MSGVVKTVGKGLGSVAKLAAPVVSKLPGVGTFIAPLLAAGGNVLQGHNLQSTIQAGLGALNPLSLPGGGGMLGDILKGMGVGSGLSSNVPFTGFNAGQSFLNGLGFGGQPGAGLPSSGGLSLPFGIPGFNPQGQQPQGQHPLDSILGFLKDPKNLALLGLGVGGAALGNKAGIFDPRVVADPRNTATGSFANMLSSMLNGGTGTIGDRLAGLGTLPGFEGETAAGPSAGQMGDLDIVQQALARFAGGDQGQSVIDNIMQLAGSGSGLTLPPELAGLLNLPGASGLASLASGQDPTQMLLASVFGQESPERQLLLQAGAQDPTQGGQAILSQAGNLLAGIDPNVINNLISGGSTADIGQIASMLDQARQPGLQRDLRNLQENFSFSGLRNSTDAETASQRLMGESQATMTGQLAQILPQLLSTQSSTSLGALDALSRLGTTLGSLGMSAGNLGLGQQSNVLNAFGTAGNLGLGTQGQGVNALTSLLQNRTQAGIGANQGATSAMDILSQLFSGQQGRAASASLALPSAFSTISRLPGEMGAQAFNLEEILRQGRDVGVGRDIANFNQTQSLLPMLMQFLSSTPQQQVGPSLLSQLGQLAVGGAAVKQGK